MNLIFDLIIKPARSSVFRWRHLGDFKSRHRSQISYFSLESGGQGLKGTLRTKDSQGSQREHMPEILKEDPNRERSFTQYKSSGYSIIDHSDESSGSSVIHSPQLTPQPTYRSLSSQLSTITLCHKYVAFWKLEDDQHLLGLSEPIFSPLLAHP